MDRTGVIYKAENKLNNKVYIGRTVRGLAVRKAEHLKASRNARDSFYFHRAIRKHGEDAFVWTTVVDCYESDLSVQEDYWIRYWDSINTGYNIVQPLSDYVKTVSTTDQTIYRFYNPKYGFEECRRIDLQIKYNLKPSSFRMMFSKNPDRRVLIHNGWALVDETEYTQLIKKSKRMGEYNGKTKK